MNNSIIPNENENYNDDELYGIDLMLVYCNIHDECYLRKSTSEDYDNYACLLTYKPLHTKYKLASVCDYTDLYNMGIFNFYEDKKTNKVDITIIEDVRINYSKFGNVIQFSDFYNKNTESITDGDGNEITYKNNNLAEWFEYIQSNQTDFGQFLNKGEIFIR